MYRSAAFFGILALCFGLFAAVAWWGSTWPYAEAAAYLNSVAPDGDVESYTAIRHEGIRERSAWAAAGLACLALLLAWGAVQSALRNGSPAIVSNAFRADLKEVLGRYARRTSSSHKAWVAALLVGAALLRGWMLFEPITYDEAFTWTYYASRPWHVALADYSYPNNHILHTLLAKFSTQLFGVGPLALRLPAYLLSLLVLPLFYLFVRATFNRYIALLALALVAADGSLVEYGALARGYSLTWACMVAALVLGRYLLRSADRFTAVLLGLVCALGMWAVPTMIYAVAFVFIWLMLYVLLRFHEGQVERWRALFLAGAVFVAATALLYLPILVLYGPGQLTAHPELPAPGWQAMQEGLADSVLGLGAYLSDPAPRVLFVLGVLSFFFAAYTSVKYRLMVVALLLATVPLVLLQQAVAPPRVWLFILYVLHLGTAIGLFYLLKAVQERWFTKLGKRTRTSLAAAVLFLSFAVSGILALPGRHWRFVEAPLVAQELMRELRPGDRVYTLFPWEAPLEFHAVAAGLDRSYFHLGPDPSSKAFVVVAPTFGQSVETALKHHGADTSRLGTFEIVKAIDRTKIFAAPFGPPTGP